MAMPTVEQVKSDLRGPAIPIVTMLRDDLSLDIAAIQDNIRFLIQGGVATGRGMLLAGGAGGDFPMLSVEERKQLARAVFEAAEGQAPVLVGAQDTDIRVILELAEYAERLGAYGIQVSPPYYFDPADDDVIAFFRSIDSAASIPIVVYHTPWLGYTMSSEVLDALADLDWVLGFKWTHTDAFEYMRGVERYGDRVAVIDNMVMHVMSHMLGATGFITHLANLWPEHEIGLWERMDAGDYAGAQAEIQRANWPWFDYRVKLADFSGGESNVLKAAFELLGRRGGPGRLPTRPLTDQHRAELRSLLKTIGVPGVLD